MTAAGKHWHHEFHRLPFGWYWRLIQKHEPNGCIASGWAMTKEKAWDASIAAIPRLSRGDALAELRSEENAA